MNRILKFRAWLKETKEMIPVYDISWNKEMINTEGPWRFFDEIELMECTGLKDKHGKEIYEGDILRVLNDNIGEYECGEVVMGGLGLWAIRLCGLKVPVFEFIDNRLSIVHSTERIEVIGNIYEHKHLLGVE